MVEDLLKYKLNDVVELKRPHPCRDRSRLFQIVYVGADIKIKCLGCGNIMMLTRDLFNRRIKKIVKNG